MITGKVSNTKLNQFAEKHVSVEVCSQSKAYFSVQLLKGLENPNTHFRKI